MFVSWLLKLISPPHCSYCKVFLPTRDPLCVRCRATVRPVLVHVLKISAAHRVAVHAVADYQEPLRSLILAKQRSDRSASEHLAVLIMQHVPLDAMDFDCIVPIPLHWYRQAWRGFNQAECIAEKLARVYKKPVVLALRRKRRTVFQSTLSAEKRLANVRDAFEIDARRAHACVAKKILLVDDLMTTGATVSEAARVLYTLKPLSITVVVACRVIS